jgi:hypothetical protein
VKPARGFLGLSCEFCCDVAPLRRRWAASLISMPRPHGNNFFMPDVSKLPLNPGEEIVNGLIYLIGLIVVILFILSFLGLR